MQTNENEIGTKIVGECQGWPFFQDGDFVRPDCAEFTILDKRNALHMYDCKTEKKVGANRLIFPNFNCCHFTAYIFFMIYFSDRRETATPAMLLGV